MILTLKSDSNVTLETKLDTAKNLIVGTEFIAVDSITKKGIYVGNRKSCNVIE